MKRLTLGLLRKDWASSAPRRERETAVAKSVDGRSLRATGRTEQFNFRAREGLKSRAARAAAAEGITLGEWMERAIEAALTDEES